SLLNEQLVAKNLIWAKINKSQKTKTKSVVIVHGGPGTGKSLIAINILAEAARRGLKVFYGCKSKPFTAGLKHLVGREGELLFSNLYRFVPAQIKENELDILLVDEAHRIEKKSNFQFMRAENRTDMPQVDQLIRCAKTTVFFIDDKQNVRSREIGGSLLLKEGAEKFKRTLDEVVLTTQFRCMGSNDYLLWLESTLGYSQEKRFLSKNEIFEFKIFDNPKSMYEELRKRENEKQNSARIVAGFCWPWSQALDSDGELVKDVQIGSFAMPWETHGKITPPEGYVRWYEWAYKPEGFKQVGCIYTAQGFEFDYVGVIIGKDLIYDPASDGLKADIAATKDPTLRQNRDKFETHVKNIYRTLLTRGMRGCYVYFVDKDTEKFFKSRMESFIPNEMPFNILAEQAPGLVPLYSLEAAAGAFGSNPSVQEQGWVKVPGLEKPNPEHFVARVVGKSMEPLIPDGSYCLFRRYTGGSREGKIVLAQSAAIQDPENSGSFTVKKYHSEKVEGQDDDWSHAKIELHPINKNYKPIVLSSGDGEINVLAEFQRVIFS
ncbi:MAG TPA: DNA/RNA helicase domain-containing protein, partial [bacterium]